MKEGINRSQCRNCYYLLYYINSLTLQSCDEITILHSCNPLLTGEKRNMFVTTTTKIYVQLNHGVGGNQIWVLPAETKQSNRTLSVTLSLITVSTVKVCLKLFWFDLLYGWSYKVYGGL